jgi:hypothetical protein
MVKTEKARLPVLVAVSFCILCSAVTTAYFLGYQRGHRVGSRYASALGLEGGFVASFSALQRLRSGSQTDAIDGLEAFCYSSAVGLLQQPDLRSNVVGGWFREDLMKYRAAYSNAPSRLYPTTQRLDAILQMPRVPDREIPSR